MNLYAPAKAHNSLMAPAVCLCVECSRYMLTLRCPVRDAEGRQCGDYKGHRPREHTLIVLTVFAIAEERTAPT